MRIPHLFRVLICFAILAVAPAVFSQEPSPAREKTRERLNALLQRLGPEMGVTFKPSSKSQYVFTGVLREGLKNAEQFEIVISVSTSDTIGFRIFPHYKGGYINIDKARNGAQLLRKLVQLNDTTFLFWGADESGDVFTGYTFTLESGFPDKAIEIVLSSIKNSDQFVGELRPAIDGSNAP
ncbi:MAG TPA: hypothetical protein VLB87_10150 [Pyrinomonadaceae bacterium]|nr:hypothetical protein [Pyrinomonadaceae bacterium]